MEPADETAELHKPMWPRASVSEVAPRTQRCASAQDVGRGGGEVAIDRAGRSRLGFAGGRADHNVIRDMLLCCRTLLRLGLSCWISVRYISP